MMNAFASRRLSFSFLFLCVSDRRNCPVDLCLIFVISVHIVFSVLPNRSTSRPNHLCRFFFVPLWILLFIFFHKLGALKSHYHFSGQRFFFCVFVICARMESLHNLLCVQKYRRFSHLRGLEYSYRPRRTSQPETEAGSLWTRAANVIYPTSLWPFDRWPDLK